jgi:hypothetical protein
MEGGNRLDGDRDYWDETMDFIKPLIPSDFDEKFATHIKEMGYNDNEARLFKEYCQEAFGFYATLAFLKQSK